MLEFLEKILGKTSSYYEMLMNNRKEVHSITPVQINQVSTLLEPLLLDAHSFTIEPSATKESPVSLLATWPEDNKKKPIPYYGCIKIKDGFVNLFINEEKLTVNPSCFYAELIHNNDFTRATKLEPLTNELLHNKEFSLHPCKSLPIWEEIIWRDNSIHKQIASLAPTNPWTLYKLAKKKLLTNEVYVNVVSGYPQWVVNNIDYRYYNDKKYILQIKLSKWNSIAYLFEKRGFTIQVIQN